MCLTSNSISIKQSIFAFLIFILSIANLFAKQHHLKQGKEPVDYVNPYIGNISHLLVPTYPTIHLPNSLLRVYPERGDFTGNQLSGLPVIVTSHRGASAFNLSPYQGEGKKLNNVISYGYDNEIIKPYFYQVDLDDYGIVVKFAPSQQSAIYQLNFTETGPAYLILNSRNGEMKADENTISGYQLLGNNTKVFLYMETDLKPILSGVLSGQNIHSAIKTANGKDACVVLKYALNTKQVSVRYGISFISIEQAKKNLQREIKDYSLEKVAETGRGVWNKTLSKISIDSDNDNHKTVFYTSLYRTYERMICISEDGYYFSAFDGKVHEDKGIPFYTDDWIWDTYRAVHPLRAIIEPEKEQNMINSFIRMAEQMSDFWMPTFPEITGDSRRMNSNHGVATIIDAYSKGIRGFDLEKAYQACKNAITEKTLAPWSPNKAGSLDSFYKKNGYIPALHPGEEETIPEVHSWEKRQPVAVTLGTVYDEWCLSKIAKILGKEGEAAYFAERSLNYHKIFNSETKFFHPKDKDGKFIEPFDYRFSGGIGARDAYDENNGWVYRWDVQHNIGDLVRMMGGKDSFVNELERMYNTPLGMGRPDFHHQFGDHTGIVGQYSMGNEPSMHIPYLYNYGGQPWRTQKRVRTLLNQWFRNDLMGIPGDEDGGGLTSFVVFSSLGFYPLTPGLPMYVIGAPMFRDAKIDIGNGKIFEISCLNYSTDNKFIQSAKLNGKDWNKSWFSHQELIQGGKLEFVMGIHPNKQWASADDASPPSYSMPD